MLFQAAMWDLMAQRGIWRPVGGTAALWEGLVAAVRSRGEVLLSAEVEEVLVSDGGAVQGGRLADGRVFEEERVVSNAAFKTTFRSLVPPGAVPGPWRRTVEEARQTESVFQVCLGLDAVRADLGPQDLVETPVRGLYMAGYQAATGLYVGGVATAVRSGRRAAEAVLRGPGR